MKGPQQDLTVACVQAALKWQSPKDNRQLLGDMMSDIDADVFLLPETFTTSFSATDLQSETMTGESIAWMRELAAQKNALIGGSLRIHEGETLVNRFVWATPNGDIHHYDKRHLFTYANEHKRYTAGSDAPLIIEHKTWRLRCSVCYELRFPVWLRSRGDYDALAIVANWPKPRDDAWRALLRARAIENSCYVLACNRTGKDGEKLDFRGDSALIDHMGHTLVEAQPDTPEVIVATLSAEALAKHRQRFPVLDDADAFEITARSPAFDRA